MIDPAWKHWYRSQHNDRCMRSGEMFEQYVTAVLQRHHPDFINPVPMGRDGDGGCDGLADNGKILYACYGADLYRAVGTAHNTKDGRTANKLASDLERALNQWTDFTEWRFVTNASIGQKTTLRLIELQKKHGTDSSRPITLRVWQAPDDLWDKVVGQLTSKQLDGLMPGVPRSQDVRLRDLIDLIVRIADTPPDLDHVQAQIRPVSDSKMDFNRISQANRAELNEGRIQSARIDQWFSEQSSPDLRDVKARAFRQIYEQVRAVTDVPSEILEALYTAVGGEGFRHSKSRANAVYAVTAYFFDSCDIFEGPRRPDRQEVTGLLLPTKGILPDRSLISVGGTLISLLEKPATVSALWERFQQSAARSGRHSKVTFDWFALALTMLFTLHAVRWNDNQELERCHVPA